MAWRVAKSLLILRDQINALAPNRNKAADGTIGDAAHSASKSDHNPNSAGVVTAMDITHDPRNGVDAGKIARKLAASRDPRIKYIISNGEILSATVSPWQWRKYTGSNPHDRHFHVSVGANYDSEAFWNLDGVDATPVESAPAVISRPTLRSGSKGEHVRYLQSKINTSVDGDFGPKTERALKEFQKAAGLVADGICGPYTWRALA